MEEESNNQHISYFRPFLLKSTENVDISREQEDLANKCTDPDSQLKNGCKLPSTGAGLYFRPKFANIMLEDLDPFYKKDNNTFVVVNGRKTLYRFSATKALWLLSPFNPVRKVFTFLYAHYLFPWVILVTVFLNCVYLAFANTSESFFSELSSFPGMAFVTVYIIEFIIKILARGFILEKFSYMRDPWNWLDLIILIFAYLGAVKGANNLAGLRPLKIIGNVSSLKRTFEMVAGILRKLTDVTILTILTLTVFTLQGVHLYGGTLTQKCIENFKEEEASEINENWNTWNRNMSHWFPDLHSDELESYAICGNLSGAGSCPEDYTCLQGYGPNPDYGYTSYDSFFWGMLSTIRMMKLDFWEALYQQILRAGGPWKKLYFALVMFFCSFYMMTLIFAVVAQSIREILLQTRKQNENCSKRAEHPEDLGESKKKYNFTILDYFKNNLIDPVCKQCLDNLICHCNCFPKWERLREYVGFIIFNTFTVVLITIVLLTNIFFMCASAEVIEIREMVFPMVYLMEFLLKLVSLGPSAYFKDSWCKLQTLILLNFVVLHSFYNIITDSFGLIIIGTLRMLIIFRMAQYWPSFRKLVSHLATIFHGEMLSLLLIIQLVMATFAFLGVSQFDQDYLKRQHLFVNGKLPRWNFVDFPHSFLIVFRAICGEWIESMWDCMLTGGYPCFPYFFGVVFFGNMFSLVFFIFIYYQAALPQGKRANHNMDGSIEGGPCSPKNKIAEAVIRVRNWIPWKGFSASSGTTVEDEQVLNGSSAIEERSNPAEANKQSSLHISSSPLEKVQKMFNLIENNKFFNPVMVTVIILASFCLAFEDIYVTEQNNLASVIFTVDILFTLIIILEALLRLGAKGNIFLYFGDPWRWLDIAVIISSLVALILGETHFYFGAFRGFRILMVLSRVEKLKQIVETISQVGKRILWLIPACGALWLVFALFGVSMLNGQFYKCFDDLGEIPENRIIKDKIECLSNNFTWENSAMNFDHLGNAYLSLFTVATFKGWIGVMNDAIDSTEIDMQPQQEVRLEMYLFFVTFVIFGVFLSFSWILGEAVKELNKQRSKISRSSLPFLMSQVELSYATAKRMRMGQLQNNSVTNSSQEKVQGFIQRILESKPFGIFWFLVALAYLIIASTDSYGTTEKLYDIIIVSELIFVILITLECIFKVVAYRQHYFKEFENNFDFILTILSIFVKFVMEGNLSVSSTPLLIIKAAKGVVDYLKGTRRGMKTLILTMATSLPEVISTAGVLVVVISTYSLCGMLAFKDIKLRGTLNEVFNFQTFHQSFILIIQLATAAGWDGILIGLINEYDCELEGLIERPSGKFVWSRGDCGNATFAIPFLISFMTIAFFLVAFMFLTVILEYFYQVAQEKMDLNEQDFVQFDRFLESFLQNDDNWKAGSRQIRKDQLSDCLDNLMPPLQVPKPNEDDIILLNIPVVQGNMINSEDLLDTLIKRHFNNTG